MTGWQAALWVGSQIMVGFLGYWQGRKDEERKWLRTAVVELSQEKWGRKP